MSGTLIVDDGPEAWTPANWVFDAVLEWAAAELEGRPDLAVELRSRTSEVGLPFLDLTGWPRDDVTAFRDAVKRVLERTLRGGPTFAFYEGFLDRVRELIALLDGVCQKGAGVPLL